MKSAKYVIGIDEVGRGPLAGPVFVGAVIVPAHFDWKTVEGVRDSKKLSARKREEWYGKLDGMRKVGQLNFATASSSSKMIDRRGIVFSIQRALEKCLVHVGTHPKTCNILLDGGLHAPTRFTRQRTIIHGDDIEPIISMASIVAKVERDSLMKELALRYPAYGFETHKGYGTKTHYEMLKKHGLSAIHRRSFCSSITAN